MIIFTNKGENLMNLILGDLQLLLHETRLSATSIEEMSDDFVGVEFFDDLTDISNIW
jgi:hypothetical protein